MPTFVHPTLLWAMPLAGVPVLIHLINMMRHRRVEWAAMEFLLTSQRKNRTWIILKQLFLLLMRMSAIAILILLVAQPILKDDLAGVFGGTKTHHIVLLDDSFSMSDHWADTDAMSAAKSVIQRIANEAARQVQPQTFTLLRFSQAGRVNDGTKPDMFDESVNTEFTAQLTDLLASTKTSETAVGPTDALQTIKQLAGDSSNENRIVYLISDFRARQWNNPTDLKQHLNAITTSGTRLHLINCVDAMRPNLAITSLAPTHGTRAAGVPLFLEVTAHNFGTTVAQNVSVLLEQDGNARPAIKIKEIPPGRSTKERFLVHFQTAGQHKIVARLENDAVNVDNFRYCVLDIPADVPVLIIDGDPNALDARFLSRALSPGGPTQTGITARIESTRYLSLNPLEPFASIYLTNIEHLDSSAIDALERYVSSGGGLGIFLGERSQSIFINEKLYRNGQGLFPVPLSGPAELPIDRLRQAPDMQVTDHPIFKIFAGKRNSFLSAVMIQRYFEVPKEWQSSKDNTAKVIATLRNGAPLAVERNFGDGRVIAFLTTVAPTWNNWARNNPSFVVAIQEMQAYLTRRPRAMVKHESGTPLQLILDPSQYKPQVRFVTPEQGDAGIATTNAARTPHGTLVATLYRTGKSGVYEATLAKTNDSTEVRHFAINVDANEGDLKTMAADQLAIRLEGVRYEYKQASIFRYDNGQLAGYNLSQLLLYLLILVLIGEQVLAWSAGYHPKGGTR